MIKNFLISLFVFVLITNNSSSESRFGELTEMRDEKMRGKDNQWVRPHPGPFIWNHIEKEKGNFTWEDADQYVVYAQEHNQTILATIWPHANWEQKSCKRKKARSPFGKRFTKYLSKPCSMDDYKNFLVKLVDRYDGDGLNDMPGLTKPIKYWDVMNEPEFKMFFKGSKEDFIEIFNFSSKVIKEKQPDAVIVMAGAAGMFPESKKYWKVVLPKIKDNFDIANIHHISGPDGQCDKQLWVDEFADLLKSVNIDKPIWLTEAMTCGPPVKAWVNAFLNGAELIIDVGVNAPGKKMSKKGRKKLNEFIAEYDGFSSIKKISEKKVEFTFKDGSSKTLEF
ncbi:endo-1,4-beta-xylanase [Candidatus Pelagibacter sp.]|uniref:endo-1,4-beta-xylanase n=1 Tax=Candidatus Pelagibacter sp. TaxID=2024849 RepID=UPI003F82471F